MTVFLDISGNEYVAQTNFKVTHGVNGEFSISGEIFSNDAVLQNIDRGWRLKFEDEYFFITFQKLKDEGRNISVVFDAVHQFFWDFSKSAVYEDIDGSTSFERCVELVFANSGYRYYIDPNLDTRRFVKQNFGMKDRMTLFNNIITAAGVEFNVAGKLVSIYKEVGTDLSTVVRKRLNLNELTITRNIGNFITYQRGFGKWKDENDHSKGRLEVEYESPLAKIYGRLEGMPISDERYTKSESLLQILKKNVEDSYSLSIELSMEDLTKAGYSYSQPHEGDYIMLIDEKRNFKERVRIVSYASSYDARGNLIDHQVTCNDIGTIKKQNAGYTALVNKVKEADKNLAQAVEIANRALISADGKSTNYYGTDFPVDVPKGTLKAGDLFYQQVGDKTLMHVWNGHEWVADPVVNNLGALEKHIDDKLAEVNAELTQQEQEHNQAVANLLIKAGANKTLAEEAQRLTIETAEDLNLVKDTVDGHTRTILEQGKSISQVVQTSNGLVSRVADLATSNNLVYDPTKYSRYIARNSTSNLTLAHYTAYSAMRIRATGLTGDTYSGFRLPLRTSSFTSGEKLAFRAVIGIDVLPDSFGNIRFEIKSNNNIVAYFYIRPTRTGNNQVFTATATVLRTVSTVDEYALDIFIPRNGNVNITQISIVRGDTLPENFVDSTTTQDLAVSTQISQLAGSWAVQNLTSAGTVLNQINLNRNGSVKIDGKLVQITGETIINNGVIKSAMIGDGQIGTAQIGTIDAGKANIININSSNITSNGLTANIIKGGTLTSLNGSTTFNLQTGWIDMDAEAVGIRNLWPNYPIQYLVFGRGSINGKSASYTALMSNSKRSIGMNDGSAGIQIWNAMDNTTAINMYGDSITLAYNATDKRGININTINNDIDNVNKLIAANVHLRNYKNLNLVDLFNDIYRNLRLLHKHKTTGTAYTYSMYGPL